MIYRNQIYLAPVPDNNGGDGYTVILHAQQNYNRITWANATTLSIPTQYEYVLDCGVMAMFDQDVAKRGVWSAKYSEGLNRMQVDEVLLEDLRVELPVKYRDFRW